MTTDFRALCAELVVIEDAMSGGSVQLSSQGQALDGYAGLAAFRYIAAKARIALAQPEPVADLAAKLLAESKPMDPEMAAVLTTEARWDLYEGSTTPQPELVEATDDELLELLSRVSGLPDNDTYIVDGGRIMSEPHELLDFARAVLARWCTPANSTREESFDA